MHQKTIQFRELRCLWRRKVHFHRDYLNIPRNVDTNINSEFWLNNWKLAMDDKDEGNSYIYIYIYIEQLYIIKQFSQAACFEDGIPFNVYTFKPEEYCTNSLIVINYIKFGNTSPAIVYLLKRIITLSRALVSFMYLATMMKIHSLKNIHNAATLLNCLV